MKTKFFLFLAMLLMSSVGAYAQTETSTPLKGDLNEDGKVDAADITIIVNIIMGKGVEPVDYTTPTGIVAVDLGLPSRTLWANMNVGANSPEDYGYYFAWGETTPQNNNVYNWTSYKYCNGSDVKLLKYCYKSDFGNDSFTDDLLVLELLDDAAHTNWGDDWRMPTKAEQQELQDNTTSEWTTLNGINGRKFISKINGNSIFLPAAGGRWDNKLNQDGSEGNYWSSDFGESSPRNAWLIGFSSVGVNTSGSGRCHGFSVRPVR